MEEKIGTYEEETELMDSTAESIQEPDQSDVLENTAGKEPEVVNPTGELVLETGQVEVTENVAEKEAVVDLEINKEEAVVPVKEKKPLKKKTLAIIGACILVAFIIIFFKVIRPLSIYKNAENYIEAGELDMAESLLVSLPGDARALEIKHDIQYLRAADLVEQGKIDDAKFLLDKIPEHEDPKQLRERISYEAAITSVETGDYETAYLLFSRLGDYEDAAEQKEIVYYEALAFKSLFNVQRTLKNPSSLRITKVTFYQDSSEKGELDAIYEITATNSFGGSLGAYAYDLTLYDGKDGAGMITKSAYADPDDYLEVLQKAVVEIIRDQEVFETKVDVARMNRLLEGNATFKIDLPFQSSAVVES